MLSAQEINDVLMQFGLLNDMSKDKRTNSWAPAINYHSKLYVNLLHGVMSMDH